jgi:hypothetical protein
MNPNLNAEDGPAAEPLDHVDADILGHVARMHARLDPPPADLNERVRFAIAIENIDVEVARLAEEVLAGSGARGVERVRTITFESTSLTIMVTIADAGTPGVRLDGWLAPPGRRRVELRSGGHGASSLLAGSASLAGARSDVTSRSVVADDVGRFVFDDVGHGLIQLLVHPEAGDGVDHAATVVTPSLTL